MQAIYEVRVTVEPEIEAAYQEWIGPHMDLVVVAGGFVSAKLYREENTPGVFVAHYFARSVDDIHKYFRDKSAELRADPAQRFGNKFRAERRILVSTT